jgi:putative salt-induced outer membrane protein YdiY
MKKISLPAQSLFTFILFTGINAPIVNASEVTAKLMVNAKITLRVSLDENLNQVVATINANLKKELAMTVANERSINLMLATNRLTEGQIPTNVSE